VCGLVFSSIWDRSTVEKSLEDMKYRGPDFHDCIAVNKKFFGHVRLSLVDLDNRSNQPMTRGKDHIIFNGEVYNFKDLREELEEIGYSFSTNGDTEVLLYSIRCWGKNFYQKIDGPFAFVYYNEDRDEILFSVDSFGEKQLYFEYNSGGISISSLFQTFVRNLPDYEVMDRSINEYFDAGFVGSDECTFARDIFKVSEKYVYTFSFQQNELKRDLKKSTYFNLTFSSLVDGSSLFHKTFKRVLSNRLSVDVHYGLLLSGGVDSTYILCNMILEMGIKPKCYSLMSVHDVDYNNLIILKNYFQLDLTIIEPPVNFGDFYEQAIEKMDTPFYDAAYFSLYYLMSKIDQNIKVLICGDGADELFYSYSDTRLLSKKYRFFNRFNSQIKSLSGLHTHFAKYLLLQDKDENTKWAEYYSIISNRKLYDFEEDVNLITYKNLSERLLLKSDKASMSFSKEIRTPFLNNELYSIVKSLRNDYYISDKKIMKSYIQDNVPGIGKIKKRGFNSGGMLNGFSFISEVTELRIKKLIVNILFGKDNV
jgi:asparagine synthase (glutamine-hydrolysing)